MLSIITPVLNGLKFIENNINAISRLDIPHEHIIVDGGSTDGTLDIIDNYSDIILIHQTENTGMYGAVSLGFKYSKGSLLTYINCDDLVIKNGFEDLYNYSVNNIYDLIYSNAIFYYFEKGIKKRSKANRFAHFFLRKGYMPFSQPCSIFTKEIYERVGGLRYDMFKICGDLDLFQRFSLEKAKIKYLPIETILYSKYGSSFGTINKDLHMVELQLLTLNSKSIFNNFLFSIARFL